MLTISTLDIEIHICRICLFQSIISINIPYYLKDFRDIKDVYKTLQLQYRLLGNTFLLLEYQKVSVYRPVYIGRVNRPYIVKMYICKNTSHNFCMGFRNVAKFDRARLNCIEFGG